MNWIKRLSSICFLLLLSFPILADNTNNCVVLETMYGEKMEFNLSSKPRLIQKQDTVILTSDDTKVQFHIMGIKRLYFSPSNGDGIKKIVSEAKGRIELQQGCLCLSDFKPGEQIGIYNLAGHQIMRTVITSDGTVIIPFSAIPKGVTIIKSNKQSFKINMK